MTDGYPRKGIWNSRDSERIRNQRESKEPRRRIQEKEFGKRNHGKGISECEIGRVLEGRTDRISISHRKIIDSTDGKTDEPNLRKNLYFT